MKVKDEKAKTGHYVWCMSCARAYRKTEIKWNPRLEAYVCKYDDCNCRMNERFWPYGLYREEFGWPNVPVEGEKYTITGS